MTPSFWLKLVMSLVMSVLLFRLTEVGTELCLRESETGKYKFKIRPRGSTNSWGFFEQQFPILFSTWCELILSKWSPLNPTVPSPAAPVTTWPWQMAGRHDAVIVYLEVKNNRPDKAQNQFGIAVDNVLGANVDKAHLSRFCVDEK